jgi:hypothetical protein
MANEDSSNLYPQGCPGYYKDAHKWPSDWLYQSLTGGPVRLGSGCDVVYVYLYRGMSVWKNG